MALWRPAPSVKAGLDEASLRWPLRSRTTDGIIGDADHSSRVSDHNPDENGLVHAFDLTHDPSAGVDCARLFTHLRAVRDSRLRYAIFDGLLFRGPWSDGVLAGKARPWVLELYTGDSPHTHHMHVSVGYDPSAENDVSPWWDEEIDFDMTRDELRDLMREVAREENERIYRLGWRGELDGAVSPPHQFNSITQLRKKLDDLIDLLTPAGGGL